MDAKSFITRQLGTVGWAPICPAIAKLICPDASSNAQRDLSIDQRHPEMLLRLYPRTALCQARIEGFGLVPIIFRSPLVLAERIAFLTGGEVELIGDITLPAIVQPSRIADMVKRPHVDERLERLRVLANQRLPEHDCDSRREILKARAELAERVPVPAEPEADITEGAEEASAIDRASAIIADMLKAGPVDAAEALSAAEGAGISERTMQAAAERMGVVKSKTAFAGGWTWAMPLLETKSAA